VLPVAVGDGEESVRVGAAGAGDVVDQQVDAAEFGQGGVDEVAGPSGVPRSTGMASEVISSSSALILRAPAATRYPSWLSAVATASPMPLLAPVTTAFLLSSATACLSGPLRDTSLVADVSATYHRWLMDGNGGSGPDERLVALGRALGCAVRLAVLQALTEGDASVGELVRHTGASQPNMSNHLAVLRSAGLVSYRREGRVVRYQLASPEAAGLVRSLTTLASTGPPSEPAAGMAV
jgi:DNA-binding transcriptional ArsR family regulator